MASRRKQARAEEIADKRIERAYYKNCSGVQINIMDIGKVFKVGQAAIAAGADDEQLAAKLVEYVNTIRKN